MRINDEEFLRYYWEELLYLRRVGQSFARTHPKIAARLELQGDECPDPHVERLLESFAFLTGRIQRSIDSDFPEIAAELLNVLYPHYLQPVPSMAIARFVVDADAQLTTGHVVARGAKLFATTSDGDVCRWRTAYDVTLLPIDVTDVSVEPAESYDFASAAAGRPSDGDEAVLRIRITSRGEPLERLGIDKLRFHLAGDPILASTLYELLCAETIDVGVREVGSSTRLFRAGASSIAPVGFTDGEALLPYPRTSHPAYRIVQEYFAFPEKYHFVDVGGLSARLFGKEADLLFLLRNAPRTRLNLRPDNFVLGCTPIINLFEKTTEPIAIDQRRLEYRLVADARRHNTHEVHSILSVSGSSNASDATRRYAPFYAWSRDLKQNGPRGQRLYWHARRLLSLYKDVAGTETLLSFVDLDFKAARPADETIWAHALCTNRLLAAETPGGQKLQADVPMPTRHIIVLNKPTQPVPPPLGGQALWNLVSHLSLNYLSLVDADALRSILRLYARPETPSIAQQISGVAGVATTRKMLRSHGHGITAGFYRGNEVSLTLDERQFSGSSAFLFGTVLQHFFRLWTSTNSFTSFVLRRTQRREVWKQWQTTPGGRIVL